MSIKRIVSHFPEGTKGRKFRGNVPVVRKGGPRGQTPYEKKIYSRYKKAQRREGRMLAKQGKTIVVGRKVETPREKGSFLRDIFGGE